MSDYNSGLPIRSEADGADERVHVKICDGVTPSQMASVDSDLNVHVELHGNNPAGSDTVVKVSEQGSVNGDGKYDGTNNSIPASAAIIAHDRGASIDATSQNKRPTAVAGASNSVCLDIALHDESGAVYSASNPLPVSIEESEGTEVFDYNTGSSIASAASSNHDYTVTALKTFTGDIVFASASGKMKVEVKVETAAGAGTFNTVLVGFNSTANPNVSFPALKKLKVGAGVKIRVTRTNLDNQAQDVYSSIVGTEV